MRRPGWLVIGVLLGGPPLLAPLITKMPEGGVGDIVGPILIIGWVFISIPVSIVFLLDWFRTPAASGQGRLLRHIARAPVFVFGLTAVLIGASVLGWVAYNVLGTTQPEFRWTGMAGIGVMIGMIVFGVQLIRTSLRRFGVAPDHQDGAESRETENP